MFNYIKNLFSKKEWHYFNLVENPQFWESDEKFYRYRFCKQDGKLQRMVTHCLGLNPPRYVYQWLDVNGKPKFCCRNGVWLICKIKQG